MEPLTLDSTAQGEVRLPARPWDETLEFFLTGLGFRLDLIFPADQPRSACISGYGLRIRLDRAAKLDPGNIRLRCAKPEAVAGGQLRLTAPNGTHIEFVPDGSVVPLPTHQSDWVIHKQAAQSEWVMGRAGMQYRDLIPEREGGRTIASHIRILQGGPVADYVHYHKVALQLIYCHRGWVRVVYEDQGPPFVLHPGDCVLQPPQIRHQVLECSPGLEVIELSCPAEHETWVDHELTLPTDVLRPERTFGGQRFVRHEVETAVWQPHRWNGWECRDLGMGAATEAAAQVQVMRPSRAGESPRDRHAGDLRFLFVLQGELRLERDNANSEVLKAGDNMVIPPVADYQLLECARDLELLVVRWSSKADGKP